MFSSSVVRKFCSLYVAEARIVPSLADGSGFGAGSAGVCGRLFAVVLSRSNLDCLSGSSMKRAALGFRVHSGWTALVAVSLEDGRPRVLLRERPHLVEIFTYEFRQPYHTAEKRPAAEARSFVSRMHVEARGLAYRVIQTAQTNLEQQGYELKCCGLLLASGRPLPELSLILASHALIHTADGELFREALVHAAGRCGVEMFTAKESELLETAACTLHVESGELGPRLVDLGRSLGSPWSQDEKFAALIAWLALISL